MRKYCFILNVCFYFLSVGIVIFGFSGAYAERVLTEDVYKKFISNSDKGIDEPVLRDPTQPLHSTKKKPAVSIPLVLQAIFIRSNERSAIINGRHVSVGSVVSRHKVIAIRAKTVDLESKNKKITLNLRSGMRNAGS